MSDKFVFRTAPIFEDSGYGQRGAGVWTSMFVRIREESLKGRMLVFDCSGTDVNRARANLFNRSVGRKPNERLHTRYRNGSLHLWLTFDHSNGKAS